MRRAGDFSQKIKWPVVGGWAVYTQAVRLESTFLIRVPYCLSYGCVKCYVAWDPIFVENIEDSQNIHDITFIIRKKSLKKQNKTILYIQPNRDFLWPLPIFKLIHFPDFHWAPWGDGDRVTLDEQGRRLAMPSCFRTSSPWGIENKQIDAEGCHLLMPTVCWAFF